MRGVGHEIDWARVIVHFVIGAIIGAGLAFLIFAHDYEGINWKPAIAGAMVIGILAAVFGDRFWEGFASIMKWVGSWL